MATNPEVEDFENPDEEREFEVGAPEDADPEIEVVADDEDEAEPVVAAEEPEQKPAEEDEPPKRRNRLQERVTELARRAAEAEARAEAAERARAQYEERLNEGNAAQVGALENALKAELSATKRELIDAKTIGDYEKEVEATAKLSKLSADLSAIEAFKAGAPRQPERQEQRQQEQPKVAPETSAWLAANTWFSPQAPDYDEELAAEAQGFARKLEIKLKREGKADQIGSREYFALVDEHMAKTYPDVFDDPTPQPTRKMPAMSGKSNVAPVGRQTAPAQQPKKSTKVLLTADEKRLAEAISPNLPREQAWTLYARNK